MHKSLLITIAATSAIFAVAAIPGSSVAQTDGQTEAAKKFAVAPVDLGTARHYVILSKTGITTTGTTEIVGNLGVSPIAASAITGFSLKMDSTGRFSTSPRVTGKIFAADYASPTPRMLTTAIGDMQTAYRDAAARSNPRVTELGAGDIGGKTIGPGLYKWSSSVTIPSNVTLKGGPKDVWIFQIAGTLTISSGKQVILSGGAQAKNVFWQVAGKTTIATTAAFKGNVLGKTAIVMMTGAKFIGRALAQTAVTLDANAVKENNPPAATALESLSYPPVSGPH